MRIMIGIVVVMVLLVISIVLMRPAGLGETGSDKIQTTVDQPIEG